VDPLDLCQPNRRMEIGHAKVEAKHLVVIAPGHTVIAQQTALFSQLVVVRRDHAAFNGHHVFRGVEAEDAGAEAAGGPSPVSRANRLAGVLDDDQPVFVAMACSASMSATCP
jgi:hypothetical protein